MNATAGHRAATIDVGARRPLRVLTGFEASPERGGEVEHLITDLYTGTRYFDVRVYSAPLPPARSGIRDLAARIKPLPITVAGWDAALSESIHAALADEAAAAWTPEEVHCHQLSSPQAAALAAVRRDLPHVGFLHPSDLARAAAEPAHREALRRTVDAMDAIVVPSEPVAQAACQDLAGLREKAVTIRWGIPDHLIDMKVVGRRPRSRPRVLHVGELTRESGTPGLLAALAAVPQLDVILAGPRAAYEDLRRHAPQLIASHIDPSRDKLWELLDDVDLFIHSDPRPYSFTRAPLEAQARGIPVICPQTSGMAPLLHGAVKLDLARGELARAIALLRQEPQAADASRAQGRQNAASYRLSETIEHLAAPSQNNGGEAAEDPERPSRKLRDLVLAAAPRRAALATEAQLGEQAVA